jgi:acyl-coenzyme A thioesterase PaaI-like protein
MTLHKVSRVLDHLKSMNKQSFDSSFFKNSVVLKTIPGTPFESVVFGFPVSAEYCSSGFLEKGAINTLVDVLPSVYVWGLNLTGQLCVTSEINSAYISAAKPGDYLEIATNIKSISSQFAFTSAIIRSQTSTIATSSQTYGFINVDLDFFYKFR